MAQQHHSWDAAQETPTLTGKGLPPVLTALCTAAKIQTQYSALCGEWIKSCVRACIQWYPSSWKGNELLPSATTWMDLEARTPREISQTDKDMTSLVCGI